ncbi:MAG: flagellar motor switch protein FliM [Proteobacteria bacterium]|nr:MAG: flagellar motor switch protein FliM [Pseudomonadota bacterium]
MANSDLLSQDEIDALLSGVDGGDVDVEPDEPTDPNGIAGYDLTSQDRIVRGRMPTLEMINERFARNFRISLFNILRRSPVVSVEGVEVLKFGEYVHTLLMPSNLNIVKIPPLRGSALVVFNPKLVFSLVDCFFGGDGRFHTKIEGRDFTATEMRIVRKVLDIAFKDLEEAWEPVFPLKFEYINSEINPQFANIVSPSEVVVVSNFHVDVEAGAGYFQIAMPYAMIEPIREMLDAGVQSDVSEKDTRWSGRLHEQIKTAKVQLSATLTTTEVTLRDIVHMRAGDVIGIEMPKTVVATVGDVPVFRANFGASRGNCALKVVENLRHDKLLGAEGIIQ